MKRLPVACIVFVVGVISGCTENFSPIGEYRQSLVVYSILTISADTQFVKVSSTFDPSHNGILNPLPENAVLGASVRIIVDTVQYVFHDTVITLDDNGVLKNVHAYVHYGVDLQYHKNYTVAVEKSGYPIATATVTTFADGFIMPLNTQIFTLPNSSKDIECEFYFGKGAFAYLARFLFEYERKVNGIWQKETAEIPDDIDGELAVFPEVKMIDASGKAKKSYSPALYRKAIERLKKEVADTIRFTGAIFELQQFDERLFTYYSIVNKYPGGSTIRLDEPDYTNINNGYGIVGITSTKRQRFSVSIN